MPAKLAVKRSEGADEPNAFVFDQDVITIGRSPANLLVLADERNIVGRQHAEIRRSGDTYELVDLGSRNYTFLEGERLEAHRAYPLRDQDTFTIGDFEIRFTRTAPVRADLARTVILDNPFSRLAEELVDLLGRIGEAYELVPAQRKAALGEALREALDEAGRPARRAAELVAAEVGGDAAGSGTPPPRVPRPTREGNDSTEDFTPYPSSTPAGSPSPEPVAPPPTAPPPTAPPRAPSAAPAFESEATERVLDTLLRFTSALAGIPARFRHAFLGQTIIQSAEAAFLYDADAETLKRHLFDPDLTEEERGRRLALIDRAAQEVALHQVALLDGYRAAIFNGMPRLLEILDPDALEQQLVRDHTVFRILPVLGKLQALERLKQASRELRSEDWAAAERRVFQPAFVKAYFARMTTTSDE